VEVRRDDLAGASGARSRIFLGCGEEDLCAVFREGEAGPLVRLRLDFAGKITARTTLPWPGLPAGAPLGAVPGSADTVLFAVDPAGAATIARYSADAQRRWSTTVAPRRPAAPRHPGDSIVHEETLDVLHRIAVTDGTVALLTVQDDARVAIFERSTGASLREFVSPGEGPHDAACLARRSDRLFVATVRTVRRAPRPDLHGLVEAAWYDATGADPPRHAAFHVAESAHTIACTFAADHAGLAVVPFGGDPYYLRLAAETSGEGSARVFARHVIQAEPAVSMITADDLSLVAWEDRLLHAAHAPSLRAWVTFVDADGRASRILDLGPMSFNVSLVTTPLGPFAAYQSAAEYFSLARITCDR